MAFIRSFRSRWHVGFVALLAIGVALVTPGSAITYGQIDPGHPQVGAILVKWKGNWIEWCSGTLVATRVLLTAGHCTDSFTFYGFPLADIKVSFSPDLFAADAKWLDIAGYESHPDYLGGPTSNPHDLGVVILDKAVRSIDPGRLPSANYLDDQDAAGALKDAKFINVGYGANQFIQDTNVRMWSESSFKSLHDAWLYMSQNPHQGNGGTCFGDSGGPTYYRDPSGAEIQVAVTSWGDAVCKSTNNNYRVDLPSSLSFIEDTIATYG